MGHKLSPSQADALFVIGRMIRALALLPEKTDFEDDGIAVPYYEARATLRRALERAEQRQAALNRQPLISS